MFGRKPKSSIYSRRAASRAVKARADPHKNIQRNTHQNNGKNSHLMCSRFYQIDTLSY